MADGRPGWRAEIRAAIEGDHARLGRLVPFVLHGLIVFSLITIALDTIPDLSDRTRDFLDAAELVVVVIFTVEYALRIVSATRPLRYVFSFWGIVDLLAILPYYLTLGGHFRIIRALRLVRVFWLFKLVRYTRALDTLGRAIRSVREELIVFLIAALVVVYFCAFGVYYFENAAQPDKFASIFDGIWWAAVTLTTVGYGDVIPITTMGRVFTILVLFVGVGIIAVPTGLIATALATIRREHATKTEPPPPDRLP
ncbi:MAG: ion transporter [Bauldia sp.]|nr:ion transporter [Bauldia sp.]